MAKKIFEMKHDTGDTEWIAANTNVGAILCYLNTTECDHDTIYDSTIDELPKEKWSEYIVTVAEDKDGNDIEMTFAEYMEKENHDTTELFCSSLI